MIMKRKYDDHFFAYLVLDSEYVLYGDRVEISSNLFERYQKVWKEMFELQEELDKLVVVS